jgi:hypothetical protein
LKSNLEWSIITQYMSFNIQKFTHFVISSFICELKTHS